MTNKIQLIVAVDKQGGIGLKSGELPWKLPDDLAHFKKFTENKIVVIGFNTYASIKSFFPMGFPNRKTIVLTKNNKHKVPYGVQTIEDISQIAVIKQDNPNTDVVIAGGAEVYRQVLEQNLVDEIHVSCVHADTGADIKLKQDINLYYFNQFVANQKLIGINWRVASICAVPCVKPLKMIIETKKNQSLEQQLSEELKALDAGQDLNKKSQSVKITYVQPESEFKNQYSFTIAKLIKI